MKKHKLTPAQCFAAKKVLSIEAKNAFGYRPSGSQSPYRALVRKGLLEAEVLYVTERTYWMDGNPYIQYTSDTPVAHWEYFSAPGLIEAVEQYEE